MKMNQFKRPWLGYLLKKPLKVRQTVPTPVSLENRWQWSIFPALWGGHVFWSRKSTLCLAPCKKWAKKNFHYPLSQPFSMTDQLLNRKWKARGRRDANESSLLRWLAKCNSESLQWSIICRSHYRKQGFSHCAWTPLDTRTIANKFPFSVCFDLCWVELGSFGHRISIEVKRNLVFWLWTFVALLLNPTTPNLLLDLFSAIQNQALRQPIKMNSRGRGRSVWFLPPNNPDNRRRNKEYPRTSIWEDNTHIYHSTFVIPVGYSNNRLPFLIIRFIYVWFKSCPAWVSEAAKVLYKIHDCCCPLANIADRLATVADRLAARSGSFGGYCLSFGCRFWSFGGCCWSSGSCCPPFGGYCWYFRRRCSLLLAGARGDD